MAREMTLGRTNHGLSVKVQKILCGAHLARLNKLGVQTRSIDDIDEEWLYDRATRDLSDKMGEAEYLAAEARGDSPTASLDLKPEYINDKLGINGKAFAARSAEIQMAAQKRSEEVLASQPRTVRPMFGGGADMSSDWIRRIPTSNLEARQMAVVQQAREQFEAQHRALDPATDTALVGNDYLHEPYRELLSAQDLLGTFMRVTIPPGSKSFIASNLADARFVKTAATTSDAYGFNTAEDPTSGSQTWTPVKLMGIIPWNGEFEDDSLFAAEAALRASMERGLRLALYQAILFGDTTNSAGANINASGGSLTLGTKDPRLLWNGIIGDFYRGTHGGKSADTFAGGVDGGADAMTVTDVYDVMKDLGKFGLPDQASNLFMACSAQSYWNLRTDALGKYQGDILNKDIFGLNFLVSGNGAPTHASSSNVPTDALNLWDGMATNRNTAGVYDNTTKTKALAAIWNRTNFLVADKRQYQVKVVDIDPVDLKAIVATIRLDFKPIIANLTAQSVLYNIL